jgi:hypothetical protein
MFRLTTPDTPLGEISELGRLVANN